MMISDEDLRAMIEDELDDIADDALLRGESDQPEWEPEIDSQAVLRVLLRLEEELGVELSEDIVPVGGYDDRTACVRAMVDESKRALALAQRDAGAEVSS